jgi:hypothetical protein
VVFQSKGRLFHGTFSLHVWHQQLCMALPVPTWIHSWWRLGCTHSLGTFRKVPWCQCPTHQIFLFEGCSGGALHCELWCLLETGTSNNSTWIPWCPHTTSARFWRIHTARFWLVCGILCSGLHMVSSDISRWFAVLLPSVHTFSIGRPSIPGTDLGHPKGDICFWLEVFSYSPPVVHSLQP